MFVCWSPGREPRLFDFKPDAARGTSGEAPFAQARTRRATSAAGLLVGDGRAPPAGNPS